MSYKVHIFTENSSAIARSREAWSRSPAFVTRPRKALKRRVDETQPACSVFSRLPRAHPCRGFPLTPQLHEYLQLDAENESEGRLRGLVVDGSALFAPDCLKRAPTPRGIQSKCVECTRAKSRLMARMSRWSRRQLRDATADGGDDGREEVVAVEADEEVSSSPAAAPPNQSFPEKSINLPLNLSESAVEMSPARCRRSPSPRRLITMPRCDALRRGLAYGPRSSGDITDSRAASGDSELAVSSSRRMLWPSRQQRVRCVGFSAAPFDECPIVLDDWNETKRNLKFERSRDDAARLFSVKCVRAVPVNSSDKWRRYGEQFAVRVRPPRCANCRLTMVAMRAALRRFEDLRAKPIEERTAWLLASSSSSLSSTLRALKKRIIRYRRFKEECVRAGVDERELFDEVGDVCVPEAVAAVVASSSRTVQTFDDSKLEFFERRTKEIRAELSEGDAVEGKTIGDDLSCAMSELLSNYRSMVKSNECVDDARERTANDDDMVLTSSSAACGVETLFGVVPDVTAALQAKLAERTALMAELSRLPPSPTPPPAPEMVRAYACDLCLRRFRQERKLTLHRQSFHGIPLPDDLVTCAACEGRRFGNICGLLSHVKRVHTAPKPRRVHQCSQCDKCYGRADRLKRHVDIVHLKVERKFACDECEKRFLYPHLLRDHKNVHTGERPHKCELCDRSFRTKHELYVHTRKRHVVESAGACLCERCGRTFRTLAYLDRHRCLGDCSSSTRARIPDTHTKNPTKKHTCDVCGRAFSSKSNLFDHRSVHTRERPHVCEFCAKSFNADPNWRRHRKVCPRRFADGAVVPPAEPKND